MGDPSCWPGLPSGRQSTKLALFPSADVGAGYGFFSLAAAARGHRVHAFELAPASLEAFHASIDYNGFKHLIEVSGRTVIDQLWLRGMGSVEGWRSGCGKEERAVCV